MSHKNLPHPWTESDIPIINSASNFKELAAHTLKVIKRLETPAIMVSGPISTGGKGSRDENLKVYAKAIEYLRNKNLLVFNQIIVEDLILSHLKKWQAEGNTGYCMPILEEFYLPLFKSGMVSRLMFMPGWQSSFGAKWERNIAKSLSIEIEDFPLDWEEEFDAVAG